MEELHGEAKQIEEIIRTAKDSKYVWIDGKRFKASLGVKLVKGRSKAKKDTESTMQEQVTEANNANK